MGRRRWSPEASGSTVLAGNNLSVAGRSMARVWRTWTPKDPEDAQQLLGKVRKDPEDVQQMLTKVKKDPEDAQQVLTKVKMDPVDAQQVLTKGRKGPVDAQKVLTKGRNKGPADAQQVLTKRRKVRRTRYEEKDEVCTTKAYDLSCRRSHKEFHTPPVLWP